MNDTHVTTWQTIKLAAKIELYSKGKNHVLLNIDPDTGHTDNSLTKYFQTLSQKFLFFYWQLGHPDFQIKK